MVDFLESLGETAIYNHRPIHICLASCHYPHIGIKNCIELIVENQEGHRKDIEDYVYNKLKAPNTEIMDQIRAELLRKASGLFLWAVLVVNILNRACDHGRIRGLLHKKLDEIPEKLGDLFADILRGNNTKDDTILCLEWILFFKRSLKLEEL